MRAKYPDLAAEPKYAPDSPLTAFVEWHGEAPDPEYYRPRWTADEATHYQLYETVSEGTPLSPPFASKAELVEYLVERGDGWGKPDCNGRVRDLGDVSLRDWWRNGTTM